MTTTENSPSPSPPIAPNQNHDLLESLARITLAGLGGALAGLSVARRRGTFGASTDAILGRRAGDMARIEDAIRSSQMPMTWAIGCTTFAGIVEFSSIVSPTSLLMGGLCEMGMLRSSSDDDDCIGSITPATATITSISDQRLADDERGSMASPINNGERIEGGVGFLPAGPERAIRSLSPTDGSIFSWDEKSTQTLGDFALGGAIAGAIFKGNSISASLPNNEGIARGRGGGVASSKMASSVASNKIAPIVNLKQKRTIGRGKVIKLATKNGIRAKPGMTKLSPSLLKSLGGGKILKNGSGMVPPILKPKTGIAAGLVPGFILGIVAGLIQISLRRLDATITEIKLQQQKEEESGEDVVRENTALIQNEKDEKAFEARVSKMTTVEIQQEIDALRARAAS